MDEEEEEEEAAEVEGKVEEEVQERKDEGESWPPTELCERPRANSAKGSAIPLK